MYEISLWDSDFYQVLSRSQTVHLKSLFRAKAKIFVCCLCFRGFWSAWAPFRNTVCSAYRSSTCCMWILVLNWKRAVWFPYALGCNFISRLAMWSKSLCVRVYPQTVRSAVCINFVLEAEKFWSNTLHAGREMDLLALLFATMNLPARDHAGKSEHEAVFAEQLNQTHPCIPLVVPGTGQFTSPSLGSSNC